MSEKNDRMGKTQKHAASAEAGNRHVAGPPGGSGVSSGLQPGGTTPSTRGFGGLGSINTRGASSGEPGGGMSGQVTNDAEPHRDEEQPRPNRMTEEDTR